MFAVRPRRAELLLLTFGLVCAGGIAELAVRVLAAHGGTTHYAPVRTDRRERRPLNSRGYRDLERAIPRPPGVRRAVCLGDSFTWGVRVLFDDAWPQRVERLLARDRDEVWEAVNLGEPGFNSVQEAARLAAQGFAYEPDVVILAYVLNDSEDENAAEARRASDWIEEKTAPPARVWTFLDHSALVRTVRTRIAATLENRRRIEDFRAMYKESYPGWIAGQRALREMGGLCRERGVPFVVAIFPLLGNPLDDSYPFAAIHARVAQVAGEAGAKVVDLLPYYRGLDWRLLVVDGADDEHPNEVAYRIASQVIARAVNDVVPRAQAPAKAP